ncbi:MAG: hypothetical protein ABIU77_17240 [Ferruginibacter sp.]
MKIIKFIGHPLTLIIWFLCIIIIGEHFAGLYVFYIVLGLPHGVIHSVLAAIGIIILLLSAVVKTALSPRLKAIINIFGAILLLLSLWLFFKNDINQYNYQTLHQAMPVAIIAGFVLLAMFFCALNMKNALKNTNLLRSS